MIDLNVLSSLLAQAAPAGRDIWTTVLPFILIFGAMYFLLIAPQRKKEKERKAMISAIKVGDKVVTIGGIMGTVTAVKEDRFNLKVDDSTRLEMLKSAIQEVRSTAES
jgi:preprotein translocase subunit YajC